MFIQVHRGILATAVFFTASLQAQPAPASFYSVASAVNSISAADIGKHRRLEVQSPSVLYHWISLQSLERLFSSARPQLMPLKLLGSDQYQSLLVASAPAFSDVPGLYAWHNPVGAIVGGSNEIYGHGEAVLTMKLRPDLKIGLIVTQDGFSETSRDLADPSIKNIYDLILHVNGDFFEGKFSAGYIEWALINPRSVTAITASPQEAARTMEAYADALRSFSQSGIHTDLAPLEYIAGPQHYEIVTYSITEEKIRGMMGKLLANKERLPEWLRFGWHEFPAVQ